MNKDFTMIDEHTVDKLYEQIDRYTHMKQVQYDGLRAIVENSKLVDVFTITNNHDSVGRMMLCLQDENNVYFVMCDFIVPNIYDVYIISYKSEDV